MPFTDWICAIQIWIVFLELRQSFCATLESLLGDIHIMYVGCQELEEIFRNSKWSRNTSAELIEVIWKQNHSKSQVLLFAF
jgi:hypothetical protein